MVFQIAVPKASGHLTIYLGRLTNLSENLSDLEILVKIQVTSVFLPQVPGWLGGI